MSRSRYLRTTLTRRALRSYADAGSFARGEQYQRDGHVEDLRQSGDRITADVMGSTLYQVTLRAKEGGLDYSCDCPVGDEGDFCKHCVAVGLEWLEQESSGGTESKDTIRDYLGTLDKKQLVALLAERAEFDDVLRQKLAILAAASSENGADLKKAIDSAIRRRTFVDYYRMPAYARGAFEVIQKIEDLLEEGKASLVVELAEHTCSQCDDSDGFMSQIFGGLQEIHLRACKACPPEPVGFAKRLFEWEMRTGWDVFYGAAETYASVLGKEGLAEYRRLAKQEWDRIPQLMPGEKRSFEDGRTRVTQMMEALARGSGDLMEVAEIRKRDLSGSYHYLEVARVYAEAERIDLAIEWAEKGISNFPADTDGRLEYFLGDMHEKTGDEYAAMKVAWSAFSKSSGYRDYQFLMERALRLNQKELWRPRAITAVRERIAKGRASNLKFYAPDNSDLVAIYLWEGDAETAWTEACKGGCGTDLWLQLAEIREREHPEQAANVYKLHVEGVLRSASNRAYQEAGGFVAKIRKLTPPDEFATYLSSLVARHKAKRNFMKVLDEVSKLSPRR